MKGGMRLQAVELRIGRIELDATSASASGAALTAALRSAIEPRLGEVSGLLTAQQTEAVAEQTGEAIMDVLARRRARGGR